jgi:hypothetical protein
MENSKLKKLLFATFALLLAICFCAQSQSVCAQSFGESQRMNELRTLRDKLQLANSLRDADAVVVISERAIIEAVRQLTGMEFILSNGSVLRLTSVEGEVRSAAAVIRIGLQAKTSITVNLQLIGRITSGEVVRDTMRMPIQVTDVKLMNGRFSALFIRTLFGEWLQPETWNDELPAIELPLEFSEIMAIPANRFDVAGEMPMEITTPAYQAPLNFTVASVLVLDRRVAITLELNQGQRAAGAVQTSYARAHGGSPAALEAEIARMTSGLTVDGDLRVRLNARVINALLGQIAASQNPDFDIRLKRGRMRTEEVHALVKITNYTDVEHGTGRADVSQLNIDRIADGRINVRLSGQGEIDAKVRGREYGIPYGFSPHVTFTISDQLLPLEFAAEAERVVMRAAPGSALPISVRFSTTVAGRELGINRKALVPADRWLNGLEMPSIFARELNLPRKMEIDAGGNLYVTEKRKLSYGVQNLRVRANQGAIDITADVKIAPPK